MLQKSQTYFFNYSIPNCVHCRTIEIFRLSVFISSHCKNVCRKFSVTLMREKEFSILTNLKQITLISMWRGLKWIFQARGFLGREVAGKFSISRLRRYLSLIRRKAEPRRGWPSPSWYYALRSQLEIRDTRLLSVERSGGMAWRRMHPRRRAQLLIYSKPSRGLCCARGLKYSAP